MIVKGGVWGKCPRSALCLCLPHKWVFQYQVAVVVMQRLYWCAEVTANMVWVYLFFFFWKKENPHKMETGFPPQLAVSCLTSTLKIQEIDWLLNCLLGAVLFVGFFISFYKWSVHLCRIPRMLLVTLRWGFFLGIRIYWTDLQGLISFVALVSVLFSVRSFFPENCSHPLLQDCFSCWFPRNCRNLTSHFIEAIYVLISTLVF